MTKREIEFVLAQPREVKLELMLEFVKEGQMANWFELSKILLDAPINEGGIESEVLEDIFQANVAKGVSKSFERLEKRVLDGSLKRDIESGKV